MDSNHGKRYIILLFSSNETCNLFGIHHSHCLLQSLHVNCQPKMNLIVFSLIYIMNSDSNCVLYPKTILIWNYRCLICESFNESFIWIVPNKYTNVLLIVFWVNHTVFYGVFMFPDISPDWTDGRFCLVESDWGT